MTDEELIARLREPMNVTLREGAPELDDYDAERASAADIITSLISALSEAKKTIFDLKRQLGGGCDANYGGEHTVIKEGKYAFCAKCGESLKGVRFCHAPRPTKKSPS